jgi:hypothetical protein
MAATGITPLGYLELPKKIILFRENVEDGNNHTIIRDIRLPQLSRAIG